MKTEILNALKTRYANLGVSDSVLDRVAEVIAKTVSSSDEIEANISTDDIKGLLTAVQSGMDRLRTDNAKLAQQVKQLTKQSEASSPVNHKDDQDTPEMKDDGDIRKAIAELTKKMGEYEAIRAREEKERKTQDMMKSLVSTLKGDAYKCDNDTVLTLTLKGFSFGENQTVEDAAGEVKKQYDSNYKALYGEGYRPQVSVKTGPGGNTDFTSDIARWQAEGKLPKPQK